MTCIACGVTTPRELCYFCSGAVFPRQPSEPQPFARETIRERRQREAREVLRTAETLLRVAGEQPLAWHVRNLRNEIGAQPKRRFA